MAGAINLTAYADTLVVLGTAGVVVPVVRALGVSPILGYIAAGAALGPFGLGGMAQQLPFLKWFTIANVQDIEGIAEFGVVFLLFLIGLELSFERLNAMRKWVFGLGMAQVAVTLGGFAALAYALGASPSVSVIVGAALSLSSTAIVVELLAAQGRTGSKAGRIIFSVLLAQDLAVVPILLFVSLAISQVGGAAEGNFLMAIGATLLQILLAATAILAVGRLGLRPLFQLVASQKSRELFVATTLFVIVATGVVAAAAGLSMALGAFVAGLLLAETEYARVIESIIEPFKGLLLGVFFFSVGANLDFVGVLVNPLRNFGALAALIVFKACIMFALARAFKLSLPVSVESALLLAPGGEFAFVVTGMALAGGVLSAPLASFVVALTTLSMVFLPLFAVLGRRFERFLRRHDPVDPALLATPAPMQGHVVLVGYGRVGQVVAGLLKAHAIPYVASDQDVKAVAAERARGSDVFYGDARDEAFLHSCGIMQARALIITVHTRSVIDAVVARVQEMRPELPIIARALDAEHARHLYGGGVTEAVPDTVEASLQLSEAALVHLGVPMGLVIASVHEKRDEFRATLQKAAKKAGRSTAFSLRAKEMAKRMENSRGG
ncbi:MAG: cation:proton antiporter [Proteobacteria bacterium]|nr:cation:proton antiporter [Pseudomonadota bacterium]